MVVNANSIKSCYIGPKISPEQFISEHFFLYIVKGRINGYDGDKNYSLEEGEYCVARKNHLARYNKETSNGEFEKVVVIFDQLFLKKFEQRHLIKFKYEPIKSAFLVLQKNKLVSNYISSLLPYYNGFGKIDTAFADVKREEILLILLQDNPQLAGILFDFGIPEKIDIEAFMNKNYKFNVSIQRFAYLTGRSISSFKRDFEKTFADTPSHWLLQKRLQEAYFLIYKNQKKASEIYLELGFENLSHFSFAFKKKFGLSPSQIVGRT